MIDATRVAGFAGGFAVSVKANNSMTITHLICYEVHSMVYNECID